LDGLPPKVAKAYSAALRVQAVEANAYAVLIGRLLEIIAIEEGIEGRGLAAMLGGLVKAGRIPPVLAEMGDQLRQIRNLAAHAAADEVTDADVPAIADFADAIVEYLYRAPAKVEAVRARLSGPSAGRKSASDSPSGDAVAGVDGS
jgi:hypothetical protein